MKIEVGESLIYSFLRHEKECLVTKTNWKSSGNWDVSHNTSTTAREVFEKINNHSDFSGIFKTNFEQTIKQAEIDVLGIDAYNNVYAYEVAFHENGLQYGDKTTTRDRVIKKLLRSYIALKYYFPNNQYKLAFCSPKINPATDKVIKEYLEILNNDFGYDGVEYDYYANDRFSTEILSNMLAKSLIEADSNEIFSRSVKLINLAGKQAGNKSTPTAVTEVPFYIENNILDDVSAERKKIKIKNVEIPLEKNNRESVQDYIKSVMRLLLNKNLLAEPELNLLMDKEYCKKTFELQMPLLRNSNLGYKDNSGRARYWSREKFGGEYFVCSQWWKENHPLYLLKIRGWLEKLHVKYS